MDEQTVNSHINSIQQTPTDKAMQQRDMVATQLRMLEEQDQQLSNATLNGGQLQQ